ncbi:MAG: hypothetical protein ACRCVQ_07420 [Acinetobacter ursingii]
MPSVHGGIRHLENPLPQLPRLVYCSWRHTPFRKIHASTKPK